MSGSVIAIGSLKEWKGIRGPNFGEPGILGPKLWKEIHQNPGKFFSSLLMYDEWDMYLVGSIRPHASRNPGWCNISHEGPQPLNTNWVYIVEPEQQLLHVLAHVYKHGVSVGIPLAKPFINEEGWWDYGHAQYRHVLVKTISLNDLEPNWDRIQNIDANLAQAKVNPVYWKFLDEQIENLLFNF